MDLRSLRYFVEVVRQNSFSRAAKILHVTQPTISKMVRGLEDELGGPLLLRSGREMHLTDAGQIVYARGQELLATSVRLRQEVAEIDGMARGKLSVGIVPMTGHFMAPVIARFVAMHPGVTLDVVEHGGHTLHHLVREGDLDMAVDVLSAAVEPGLERLSIAPLRVCAVFAAQHQPAGDGPLSWHDLHDWPFILYPSDFVLHEMVLQRCAEAGFTPKVQLQTGYWDFMGELVAANVGIAIVFEHVVARYDAQRIASRPLVDTAPRFDVGLSWRTGYLSRAGRAWLDCVRAVFPDA